MSTREIIEMLCDKRGISIRKLERDLELSNGSIAKTDTPKADKLLKISEYFGVSMNYLMTGESDYVDLNLQMFGDTDSYYANKDARDYAQFLFENPEYRVLFDASRNVKKEDIEFVKQMLDRFKGDDNDKSSV